MRGIYFPLIFLLVLAKIFIIILNSYRAAGHHTEQYFPPAK